MATTRRFECDWSDRPSGAVEGLAIVATELPTKTARERTENTSPSSGPKIWVIMMGMLAVRVPK